MTKKHSAPHSPRSTAKTPARSAEADFDHTIGNVPPGRTAAEIARARYKAGEPPYNRDDAPTAAAPDVQDTPTFLDGSPAE